MAVLLTLHLWFRKAWAAIWGFVKKYWKILAAGLGALVGVLFLFRKRAPEVVAPELIGASEVKEKAEEEAAAKIEEAKEDRVETIQTIETQHAEVVEELKQQQAAKAEELANDPEGLNKFLLEMGKQMRK